MHALLTLHFSHPLVTFLLHESFFDGMTVLSKASVQIDLLATSYIFSPQRFFLFLQTAFKVWNLFRQPFYLILRWWRRLRVRRKWGWKKKSAVSSVDWLKQRRNIILPNCSWGLLMLTICLPSNLKVRETTGGASCHFLLQLSQRG